MLRRLRGPIVLALAAAGWWECWRWLAPERRGVGAGADLAALVAGLAAWLLLGAFAWLVLLMSLTVLELVLGGALGGTVDAGGTGWAGAAGCPAWLRPILLVVCGVATMGALSAPALAHGDSSAGARSAAVFGTSGIADGLPLPDRVTDRVPDRVPDRDSWVVVDRGDSLWSITRHELGPTASHARVDAGWRRLYERNRIRIGDDPDLITPGTRLLLDNDANDAHDEGRRP